MTTPQDRSGRDDDDSDRVHAEEPSEGGTAEGDTTGTDTPREHSEDPAEG